MFSTLTDLIAAITSEENEDAKVQIFVDSDGKYAYGIDGNRSALADEIAVYGEADCPAVELFFSPIAEQLLGEDIAKAVR